MELHVQALEPAQARTRLRASHASRDAERSGTHAAPWRDDGKAGAHATRGGRRDGNDVRPDADLRRASRRDPARAIPRWPADRRPGDDRLGREGAVDPRPGPPARRAPGAY